MAKKKSGKHELRKKALERKRLDALKKRGQSLYIEVRESPIHGSGVYAAMDLKKGDKVVEYVGELIDKEESEKRAWAQAEEAEKTGCAAVYIFNLTKKWDLDGSMEWNSARLINHSCDPNCEAITEKKQIFIYALRDIEKGEELSFDYGFEADTYEDHPCLCGAENCVGYIVGKDYHKELAEMIAAAEEEE